MRINIRNMQRRRSIQRMLLAGLCVVLFACSFIGAPQSVQAAEDESFAARVVLTIQEVFRQMDGVMDYTAQAIDAVFSNTVRVDERQEPIGNETIEIPDPLPITTTRFPLQGAGVGTLVINAPLSITSTLRATGQSTLASTSIEGLLEADDVSFDALSVSGLVGAGAVSAGQLTVSGGAQLNSVSVTSGLTVSGETETNNLTVNELALVASLLVQGATQLTGLLEASGGISTNGGDVDLQGGSIYASNIVNEVVAGDGITITGTTSSPTIAINTEGIVTEINGQTGEVEIRGGTDITVSGSDSIRITNRSDLGSVRGRGGCSGCITDVDVANTLTLTAGSIDGVVIGSTSPAVAFFSETTIGSTTDATTAFRVLGSGTSNFGGSINLDSGCFSIGGVCVASAASSTSYVGLSDTPSALVAGAIQFASAGGAELVQSSDFVFDGSSLAIGTTTPATTLTVEGDTTLDGFLTVTGTTTVGGQLTASGNTNLGGTLSTTGNATLGGTLGVAGSVTFSDSLTVTGFTALQADLLVTGSTTISGDLAVSGGVTLGSDLAVDGDIAVENGGSFLWYDADSSNYVGLLATTTVTGNTLWYLPAGDGFADQVLVTDGNGNLRFDSVSAIGGGATEYVALNDTPSSFASGTIPYGNASGTALVHSTNLQFDGVYFSIGPAVPSAELTVDGSVDFIAGDGSVDFTYDDTSKLVGIGTSNPTTKLSLQGGSFSQIGGSSENLYSPSTVRVVTLPDIVFDVVVAGAYAYVTTNSSGDDFHIYDLRDSSNPVVLGAVNLPASANALQVSGRYAYVVTSVTGNDFHVIDLSDKDNPIEVESLNLSASGNDLAIQGNYAYVVVDGTTDSFSVIDISNPTEVSLVGTISLPASAKSVEVRGNYAFVTTEVIGNDFHVIDISDPTSPSEVESISLPTSAITVALSDSGQYAYVGTAGTGDDLHTIDISDPLSVSVVDSLALDAGVTSVYVAGDLLYVSTFNTGNDFYVVDATSPTALTTIGVRDFGAGNTYSAASIGKYVYLATAGGLIIVDVSGAQTQSLYTYSLETRDMFVVGNSNFANSINISGSVNFSENLYGEGILQLLGSDSSYILGGLSIGTTSTSTGLIVAGTMNATNLLGGAVNITTDANGNIIRDPSDVRLKTNITDVEDAIDVLMGLRGVRYEWRDKERFGSQIEIGFIAQEVDLVLPEVVRKGGDYWSINTRNVLAVVVEAVKDVWVELQGTQQDVSDLRERVGQLESQLTGVPVDSDDVDEEVVEGQESAEEESSSREESSQDSVTVPETENATSTPETVLEEVNATSTPGASDTSVTSTSETEEGEVEEAVSEMEEEAVEEVQSSVEEDSADQEGSEVMKEESEVTEEVSEESVEVVDGEQVTEKESVL